MTNLVETRTRAKQNPPYKGGGKEISSDPVGRMNENKNPRVACR